MSAQSRASARYSTPRHRAGNSSVHWHYDNATCLRRDEGTSARAHVGFATMHHTAYTSGMVAVQPHTFQRP